MYAGRFRPASFSMSLSGEKEAKNQELNYWRFIYWSGNSLLHHINLS